MGLGIIADYALLFPTAAIVGFAYGGLWGVVPVLILELFGPSNFGTLVSCMRACVVPACVPACVCACLLETACESTWALIPVLAPFLMTSWFLAVAVVVCMYFFVQYTTLAVMPAASSLVLATAVAGSIYDRHAVPPADGDGPSVWCAMAQHGS